MLGKLGYIVCVSSSSGTKNARIGNGTYSCEMRYSKISFESRAQNNAKLSCEGKERTVRILWIIVLVSQYIWR